MLLIDSVAQLTLAQAICAPVMRFCIITIARAIVETPLQHGRIFPP
jgi:hypothetical protein